MAKTYLILAAIVLLVIIMVIAPKFLFNVFAGRVQFPDKQIGQVLIMEDGMEFEIFRDLKIRKKTGSNPKMAVFVVRFQFDGLETSTNKRLSIIPAPFLMGMKGFRQKYWMYDESTGFFQGIYQWESKEYAARYPES